MPRPTKSFRTSCAPSQSRSSIATAIAPTAKHTSRVRAKVMTGLSTEFIDPDAEDVLAIMAEISPAFTVQLARRHSIKVPEWLYRKVRETFEVVEN